jgi:hypothetical protein
VPIKGKAIEYNSESLSGQAKNGPREEKEGALQNISKINEILNK